MDITISDLDNSPMKGPFPKSRIRTIEYERESNTLRITFQNDQMIEIFDFPEEEIQNRANKFFTHNKIEKSLRNGEYLYN